MLLVGAVLAGCRAPDPPEWPQWRGAAGDGTSNAQPLPAAWGPDSENIRWRAEIPGTGNSSPVAANGRVFLTTSYQVDADPEGNHWRVVLGYDLATGQPLFETRVVAAPAEKRHWLNTLAGPSPATDGRYVYAYFGAVLAKLDRDGGVVWQLDIDPDYYRFSRYGAASSVVLHDDLIVIAQDKEYADTEDVGWLAAYDRNTGVLRWRTEWTDTCCSYSTPIVIGHGKQAQVVFAHSGAVVGYDLETGNPMWHHEYPMLQMVSTPVQSGNLLAILGGADNQRGNVMLRLSEPKDRGGDSAMHIEELWRHDRLVPQVSSPVFANGLLFSLTVNGVLVCWQPETGEVLWQQRLARAKNHAALAAADGKVYAVSATGSSVVVAAANEVRVLAENELGELGTTASPAIAGGCLLVRGERHLFCIEAESR